MNRIAAMLRKQAQRGYYLKMLSLFQRLCKPPNWCKIKTLVWRFYYVKKKDEPRGKSKKGKAP